MPHDVRTPNLSLTPLTPDTFDTLTPWNDFYIHPEKVDS